MNWIKNALLFLVTLGFVLLLLELVLSLMPVMTVTRSRPLAATDTAIAVSGPLNGKVQTSSLWNFKNARVRKTNNQGLYSDFDYSDKKATIFAIGDSFVEAVQVEFDQTFHQILAKKLNRPIYNFAISGAPLSQYEAYARYICQHYEPRLLIFVIIGNDFDESYRSHAVRNGFFHYDEKGNLSATPYHLSWIRRAANRSALIRYVYFNLNLGVLLRTRFGGSNEPTESGTRPTYQVHERAGEQFLENISDLCVSPSRIFFVVDALRNNQGIYGKNEPLSYMANFANRALSRGYEVVDLSSEMLRDYQTNRVKFEYEFDSHWNAYAHRFVANLLFDRIGVMSGLN